jgi:hypothetical protein
VGEGRLRIIAGEVVPVTDSVDPERFQAECVEAFVASWTARGFAESTIANDVGVLERMLHALGRPAWDVTADDVDRVVGALATSGRAVSTRRNYVQVFKGFHRFLEVRKAAEIEASFGVRLTCPLDEFNAARHVGDNSPATNPPPQQERVAAFFEFLKMRIATARKYGPAARDYALFRILYHAGLRAEEVVMLDRCCALPARPSGRRSCQPGPSIPLKRAHIGGAGLVSHSQFSRLTLNRKPRSPMSLHLRPYRAAWLGNPTPKRYTPLPTVTAALDSARARKLDCHELRSLVVTG